LRGASAYNYAVNNAGRIKTLTIGTTLRATWTYDGFQKLRIKAATSPAATTHYIWDSFGHIISEHNATGGAALKQYIWLGDTPLAVFDNTTLYYVHPDHLDRPVAMTNATAMTIAWAAKYDPFGNPVAVTVSPVNNQRLPGQWFQSEDGLAYNWHRTYDPTLGRYTQADPLGFVDGPGIYNYAGQSPLTVTDPTGQCPWCATVFFGALFGAALDAGIQYVECGEIDFWRVGEAALIGGIGAGIGGAGYLPWFGKGLEGSHWIPARYFRPKSPFFKPWLPKWLNGPLNKPKISPWRHFKHDPFRFPKGASGMGKKWIKPVQQLDRVPDWIKGGAGGAAGFELDQ
jgi:RHS repeat-associated protein